MNYKFHFQKKKKKSKKPKQHPNFYPQQVDKIYSKLL